VTRRQNRVFVYPKLPQRVPALIMAARAILEACGKHPGLENPQPSLADVTALVDALADAEVEKNRGGPGKREARDLAADKVRQAMHDLAKCVEIQANRDPEHAEAFVAAAGMSTRAASSRRKKPFTLKAGAGPGSAAVEVIAVDDAAFYKWFCSLDGGETFRPWTTTSQSKTTLTGLPSGLEVHFYCEATGRDGVPWTSETLLLRIK
jgi:hypothetical protein